MPRYAAKQESPEPAKAEEAKKSFNAALRSEIGIKNMGTKTKKLKKVSMPRYAAKQESLMKGKTVKITNMFQCRVTQRNRNLH